MEIEQNVWGFTEKGEAVVLYIMRNASGAEVRLTNVGAAVVSVKVPDRNGVLSDVALGYGDFKSYFGDGAAMGKTVGRYANRIARGRFVIDGEEYRLACNNGPNHLHGGVGGFGNKIWESRVEVNRVVFSLISPDGDQGYPGELSVEVVYDWDDDCALEITLLAHAADTTVVNLTNHAYFNLKGEGRGNVLDHFLTLYAGSYLPTDQTQIPTGEIVPVKGSPMDFTLPKTIGRDIGAGFPALEIGNGYDHAWVIDGGGEGKVVKAAELYEPASGRMLTVLTDQPGVQVYTGNYLQGSPPGKSGRSYDDRDGVAIECQGFPDAPNHPEFPSQRLDAGQVYERHIIYRFGIKT